MPLDTQLGSANETTYGTAVTVTRFSPYDSENIQPETFRTRSSTLRAGKRAARADEYVPGVLGYAGPISMPVYSAGFGIWLGRALGSITSSGPTAGAYAHVATLDMGCPPSFTMQVNRAFAPCGTTDQAMTWEGVQIESWELSMSTEELLQFSAEVVAEDGTTGTALATASYPTGMEPLSWARASVLVNGTSLPVTEFKVACKNNLKTDRRYLADGSRRAIAPRNDFPEITVEFQCDWSSLSNYSRAIAETPAGTRAPVVFTAEAPTAIGTSSTHPSIVIELPAVDFTQATANVENPEMLTESVQGMALENGTNQPITITYTSTDSTP